MTLSPSTEHNRFLLRKSSRSNIPRYPWNCLAHHPLKHHRNYWGVLGYHLIHVLSQAPSGFSSAYSDCTLFLWCWPAAVTICPHRQRGGSVSWLVIALGAKAYWKSIIITWPTKYGMFFMHSSLLNEAQDRPLQSSSVLTTKISDK
jgi:hypothetical protein